MIREPNTQYVLSLSYGKDSIACLAAIEQLGLPLDRIVHAEVWATDTIPADLPPMVEFKKKADAIIKERWGIEVEHICAMRGGMSKPTKRCSTECLNEEIISEQSKDSQWLQAVGADISNTEMHKLTYQDLFYRPIKNPRTKATGGGEIQNCGIPNASTPLVQRISQSGCSRQEYTDSQCEKVNGAAPISKSRHYTGFATKWSQYCTTELKKRVFYNRHCTRRRYKCCAVSRHRRR